jgi:hypothetical protein
MEWVCVALWLFYSLLNGLRLAKEAYELDAFKPNVSRAETDTH